MLVENRVERAEPRLPLPDAGQRRLADLNCVALSARDGAGNRAGRLVDGARHHGPRGTLKRPASRAASGAFESASGRGSDGDVLVRPLDRPIQHVRRGRDAGGVEAADLLDVVEDVTELPGEEIELARRELEPRQFGDPRYLRARQRRSHSR